MIPAALVKAGKVIQVFREAVSFRDNAGTGHTSEVLSSWTSAELKAIDVYPLVLLPPPDRFHIAGESTYTFSGTEAQEVRTDTEIPLADAKNLLLSTIRYEAYNIINAKWPDFKQRNADSGIYPAGIKAQKDSDIASVILASNTAEDGVIAATTLAEAAAIAPVWPTI